jgi:polycomb group RING finger protein 4
MDLSPAVVSALQTTGDPAVISDNSFAELVKLCLDVVIERQKDLDGTLESGKFGKCDIGILKQSYSALATLIVEAARVDANTSSLTNLLEDCKMAPERIEAFNQLFLKRKPEVRAVLGSTRNAMPHVVDVNWRLDYYMKVEQVTKSAVV